MSFGDGGGGLVWEHQGSQRGGKEARRCPWAAAGTVVAGSWGEHRVAREEAACGKWGSEEGEGGLRAVGGEPSTGDLEWGKDRRVLAMHRGWGESRGHVTQDPAAGPRTSLARGLAWPAVQARGGGQGSGGRGHRGPYLCGAVLHSRGARVGVSTDASPASPILPL